MPENRSTASTRRLICFHYCCFLPFGIVFLYENTSLVFVGSTNANRIEFPEDPYTYTWHKLAPGVWSGVREGTNLTPVMGSSTFVIRVQGGHG
jgi:hypothetical protein